MDPDTSKKVNDLLSLMDDISTDVDTRSELENLLSRIRLLEETVSGLAGRMDSLEKTYLEKQRRILSAAKDLKSIFTDNR
ncbi:MAG TPA: hypothetical protein ENN05_08190 [Deltaproteobacteria bacterium]|nr:hypothetical protein [Deltaproteobacteria bacterium]